jgi:MOSC domain-containing protein YiiM
MNGKLEIQGRLAAIWVKRVHRGPMDQVDEATLVAGRGIVGNADQGRRRQVIIIEEEIWVDLMAATGGRLDPSTRRANLMVRGLPLVNSRGKIIQLGSCRIRVLGESRGCERMDEAQPGLRAAMYPEWRGGAFGEVLDDGVIRRGDLATWLPAS